MSYVIFIYTTHSYEFVQQINSTLAIYMQSHIKTGKDTQKYGKLLFINSSNGYRLDLPYALSCRGPRTQLRTLLGLRALSCGASTYHYDPIPSYLLLASNHAFTSLYYLSKTLHIDSYT